MATTLLFIHLLIAAALVGVVLLQKSEGGALGMGGGGGGGGGGFLTGRGQANLLTRATAGLAAAFFATSIGLTILASRTAQEGSAFDTVAPVSGPSTSSDTSGDKPAETGRGGILDKLQPPASVPQNR